MSGVNDGIPPFLRRGEWLAGLLATFILVAVHLVLWNSTGGLWRDEVTSATVVSNPTYVEMWRNNHEDSFPILFGTFLRSWIQIGFGDSDFSLRGFGFAVSMAIVAALWLLARETQVETPLLSLLFVAILPVIVRYGSSVRGYGLGVFWLLMCLWSVLRLLRESNRKTAVVYALMSLAAVQTSYTNCLMILAISMGAGAVCLATRAWRTLAVLIVSGLISVASMLAYLPTIRSHKQWSNIQQIKVSWSLLFQKFTDALTFGWEEAKWLWFGILCLTVLSGLRIVATRRSRPASDGILLMFAAVTMPIAAVATFVYFKILSVQTADWYYMPLLSLCGVLFDAVIFLMARQVVWIRQLRLMFFVLAASGLLFTDFEIARQRLTSVDLLAGKVASLSDEKDLILVTHWQASATFDKYYHGKTRWMTVPELQTRRQNPYPEYKQKMTESGALDSVLTAIEQTLSSGGRVWLVDGGVPPLQAADGLHWFRPYALPPAPNGPWKWEHPHYDYYWRNETVYFLMTHAKDFSDKDVWGKYQILPTERMSLYLFSGWHNSVQPDH